jgi:drug/metabolite transporter (DMT)-like permease
MNSTENRTKGILWMLATMLCFITLDAIMKYALATYPLVQVTWGRFFFASICAVLICGRQLPVFARTESPGIQAIRSVLLMTTTGLFNAGVWQIPLATATTIMFLSPILVTVLSIFLLSEHVGLRRWAGIGVGFLGALIVVNPFGGEGAAINHGALFLIGASLTNALYQVTTRKLRFDHPMTSLLFTAAAGAIVTSFILPWFWKSPDLVGWALFVASGIMGCLGHLCLIRAFHAAPASVVAPYSYSSLVWSTLFGFVIWGETLDGHMLLGASLIVAAGLYIFLRERQLGLQKP